ncbi:endonuclease [Flavobacterium crassostreae]|uniref:endonuclease n=1 Tax=Flavobacterium crassostreae TaxID=1763534 RepID=UPI0008A53627|nr:endonuclease [Flavobacterium crassostreae]
MKKIILLLSAAILCLNCSTSNEEITPVVPKKTVSVVAVNDQINISENTAIILQNLLANDTLKDNTSITSIDATSSMGGTIQNNNDKTYTYTPAKNFTGTDSFEYTLCDLDQAASCSTAKVTITVTDKGNPTAQKDLVTVGMNTTTTISTLVANDLVVDDATISNIDNTGTKGSVKLHADGTVTYTPSNGFVGTDTFKYSLCDNDVPTASCSEATVIVTVVENISFSIPNSIKEYYSSVFFCKDKTILLQELKKVTTAKHTTHLSYGQRHQYLYKADQDPNNTKNVLLMYSGQSRYWEEYTSGTNSYMPQTFNTEHIYPQSKLTAAEAVSDLHHLRSCDDAVNSLRSNYSYTDGTGSYALKNNQWYPGDDWRGDVARMVLYLAIRYGESVEKVGTIDLFLKWNKEDPVSAFEIQRNNVIANAQGVRNPFIDNPYLATLLWDGQAAQNRWE